MPFNGSGTFVRLYSWANDALAGIKIRADRMDNETNGIATGLSNCITKDGQTTVTANLPMATFKHTAVGAATNRTDYAQAAQLVEGVINWKVAGGTGDAITASYTIPTTTLVDGQLFYIRASAANTLTAPTFSPDGLTPRTITAQGGGAIAVGAIQNLVEMILRYNLANTRYEWVNYSAGNVVGQASSVDSEIALFSGTGGKTIKRATGTGVVKVVSGVYQTPATIDTADVTNLAITSGKLEIAVQNAILDQFQGVYIDYPADQDYRLLVNVPYGFTISSITTRSISGTCTATFKINTTALGGSANSVSSSEQTQTHSSANVLVAGDDLVLTISSNSSCLGVSIMIKYARAF